MTDDSWKTPTFRQSVVSKIDEAVRQSGTQTQRNSMEMESHVFQKARTKEEYLGFVARLILHVRELKSKQGNEMNGRPGSGQGALGMPDPINALQNLASQGSRNNQIMGMNGPQSVPIGGPQQMPPISAANLLQTLNRGPGQGINNMQNGMQPRPQMVMGNNGTMPNQMGRQLTAQMNNQLAGQMGGQMQGQIPNAGMGQMGGPLANQLQNQINNQMQGQVGGPMGNQVPNQLQGQMQSQMGGNMQNQLGGNMGNANQMPQQLQNQMPNQMMQLHQQMNRKPPDNMMMNVPNAGFPRNATPNQFLTQSPTPSVQSPAGLSGPPPSSQMVASPALVHSPGSQMNLLAGPQKSVGMAPSPSSSLNTPGQPGQSPMGMQEDQAYREKVRQLSKYIEPLRKMIAKMGNDGEHVEKLSKMKKLLEILSNPSQRMPLETLIKCEVVLEKLDFKRGDGSVAPPANSMTFKEHHCFNPILEAVNNNLQNSSINHTLHRTFGPTLEALFGPEIRLVPPLKRKRIEEPTSEIPDVLQGEIARLDQRFKVSLDPNQQRGSKTIQLLCWLDDKHLPCVPPVSLVIPEDYPKSSPQCYMAPLQYNATEFLSGVQNALNARIKKLPKYFSVSQLLDTWEMSVRQASRPSNIPISSTSILMGL